TPAAARRHFCICLCTRYLRARLLRRRPTPRRGITRLPVRVRDSTRCSPRGREGDAMFLRTKQFQYNARPDRPDPIYARKLQEVLGGQWGEISVMMTYLFQGWNCRAPAKYRDMILDIGTEE